MPKLTEHQQDMVKALSNIPRGEVFYVRRTREAGYPHGDAAKVLQQDAILGVYVGYSSSLSYDSNGIRYVRENHHA